MVEDVLDHLRRRVRVERDAGLHPQRSDVLQGAVQVRRGLEVHANFVAVFVEDEIAVRVRDVSDAAIEVTEINVHRDYGSIEMGRAIVIRWIADLVYVPMIIKDTVRGAVVEVSRSKVMIVPVKNRIDIGHTVSGMCLAIW